MELIKKIKETEKQACRIIDDAKENAVKFAEELNKTNADKLAQSQSERKKIIAEAIAAATAQGEKEAEQLQNQAKEQCRQLIEQVSPKIPSAVNKVVEYLKG